LATLLDEKHVVHVRGTPSSGKTTLAKLLADYYLRNQRAVVTINLWTKTIDPLECLVEHCNSAGYVVNRSKILDENIVIILDEAQTSYADDSLWLGPIKSQSGQSDGLSFCLFASYGSPTSGAPEYPLQCTPVHLGPAQRVSLTISNNSFAPDICLFLREDEFKDVVDRRCSNPSIGFNLDSAARKYLFLMTNGHAGAVGAIIKYLAFVRILFWMSST
jgi:hypothetical protein